MSVNIPLTGAGGTTATVATDQAGGAEYQLIKLVNGVAASTVVASVLTTTPASGDGGLIARIIGSTGYTQAAVLVSGSTANTAGSVALLAGTTANSIGSVALVAGTSANTVGSVALVAGSSANVVGQVTLQAGTSANTQQVESLYLSSGNIARTTVNTSVDVSVIATNATRKALIIANLTTGQLIGLGLSTGAVTTGMTNINLFLPAQTSITFGFPGTLPLWKGPIRGINLTSTSVAGGVGVSDFT